MSDPLYELTCMYCGELFPHGRNQCPHCGREQPVPPNLNVWGLGFMQNRLRGLVSQGELSEPIARRLIHLLRGEQLQLLGKAGPPVTSEPVTRPPTATTAEVEPPTPIELRPPAPAVPEATTATPPPTASVAIGALDASLSGPNLLLYLGAFLIAVSGLMLAAITPEELSAQVRMILGIGGTIGFLTAGLALHPNERVRPAARTFLVLGAVLVPIVIWSIGTVVLDPDHGARSHLLLGGSLMSAALYSLLAMRGYGTHFTYLMAVALVGVGQGTVLSAQIGDAWVGLVHLTVATAVLTAATSRRLVAIRGRVAVDRLVEMTELYALISIVLFAGRVIPQQEVYELTIAAGAVFAVFARTRVDRSRSELWSWVACIGAVVVAIDVVLGIEAAVARVAALLIVALTFWIAPLRLSAVSWARVPGTTGGWLAALTALLIGLFSEPEVRALALAGISARLWYDAWALERLPGTRAPRVHLVGALSTSYLLWISLLQVFGVLPERLDGRGAVAYAWATAAVAIFAWAAAIRAAPAGPPWLRELRLTAHSASAVAILLMLAAPDRVPPFGDGSAAVGLYLGALSAVLAVTYTAAIRGAHFRESAALGIVLSGAALAGALESLATPPISWAVLAPALVGSLAFASLAFVRWPSPRSVRVGGVAAFGVGLVVHSFYGLHPHGREPAESILILLVTIPAAYLLPQVAAGHRWTLAAGLTALAFLYARAADVDQRSIDPGPWMLPFVLVLAAPGIFMVARRLPVAGEARGLLFAAASATSITLALALGADALGWVMYATALVALLVARIALRLGDQAIAGAPVALGVVVAEYVLRSFGLTDMLIQGVFYGAVALTAARFLSDPKLAVDPSTVQGVFGLGVGLLTVPAILRAFRPGGWGAIAYISVLAAALLTAAVRLRRPVLGIVGSIAALLSVLAIFVQAGLHETLIYTTTVGAYLTVLGLYLARGRELHPVVTRDVLPLVRWTGPLLLLMPWVVRSWKVRRTAWASSSCSGSSLLEDCCSASGPCSALPPVRPGSKPCGS